MIRLFISYQTDACKNLKFRSNFNDLWRKYNKSAHPCQTLTQAISFGRFKICEKVIELAWYDINYVVYARRMNGLLSCANSTSGYAKSPAVKQSENCKLFTYRLDQPDIDISATDIRNRDVNALLFTSEKQ